jgi:competence protein ComGC
MTLTQDLRFSALAINRYFLYDIQRWHFQLLTIPLEITLNKNRKRKRYKVRSHYHNRRRPAAARISELDREDLLMNLRRFIKTPGGIVCVIIMILVLIFIFNLLKFNRHASPDDAAVQKNVKTIESYNYSSIARVQSQVNALDESNPTKGGAVSSSSSGNSRVQYMKKFNGSVVIGDSLTEGLTAYGFLSDDQVFCKIGASVMHGDSLFTSAARTYPKTAFFAFGMNDMGNYNGNTKPFIARYTQLLKKFHKISPKTKIYICSITKPSDKTLKKRKVLKNYNKFNTAIEKMCMSSSLSSIRPVYINITGILEQHSNLYAGDGIHAQPAYYPYWLDEMAQKAGL